MESPVHIRLADQPQAFADACVELLDDAAGRKGMADAAWQLVSSQFSWDRAVRHFEQALERAATA